MTNDHIDTDGDKADPRADDVAPVCPGRRAVLGCALAAGMVALLGESAEAATTAKLYSAGTAKSYVLNKPKLVQFLGGQAAVFVTKISTTGWQCLWAGCPHQGALLSWTPNHGYYYCPEHGATFARNGRVTKGPARSNLLKLPVKVVSGKVMVDLSPAGFV